MDGAGRLTRRKRRADRAVHLHRHPARQRTACCATRPRAPFGTNLLWERAIGEGRLYGVAFTGQWFEVGTPEAIAPTEEALAGG